MNVAAMVAAPASCPAPVLKALEPLRALHRQQVAKRDELFAAETEALPAAKREDAEALATALVNGDQDPGQRATVAVEQRIANLRREVEALQIAVERTAWQCVDLVRAHQDDWLRRLERENEARCQRYATAIAELDATRRQVEAGFAASRWIKGFPATRPSSHVRPLRGVTTPSGEPVAWEQVHAALVGDLDSYGQNAG